MIGREIGKGYSLSSGTKKLRSPISVIDGLPGPEHKWPLFLIRSFSSLKIRFL